MVSDAQTEVTKEADVVLVRGPAHCLLQNDKLRENVEISIASRKTNPFHRAQVVEPGRLEPLFADSGDLKFSFSLCVLSWRGEGGTNKIPQNKQGLVVPC